MALFPKSGLRPSCSDSCRLRARRAAKRERLETALANLERKVETFGGEMRSAIDSLRTELLADNGGEERDRHQATAYDRRGRRRRTETTREQS